MIEIERNKLELKLKAEYFPSLGLRQDIPLWNYLGCRIHSGKYSAFNLFAPLIVIHTKIIMNNF